MSDKPTAAKRPATAQQPVRHANDYLSLPLTEFTVRDLTDALTVAKSAELIKSTPRGIYTMRNTGRMGRNRMLALIEAVRANEAELREQLVVVRRMRETRQPKAA